MRNTPKILCLVTLGLLLLTILQGATSFIKIKPLKGVYVGAGKPQFTPAAFLSGEWQKATDQYLKEHHGFREPAIRLYNQYLWSAYHRSTNPGAVVVGGDNYLFEPWFVDEYYTGCFHHYHPDSIPDYEKPNIFYRRMSRVAKLQAILEEQGVHLFLALLPGKERIYPQYLPDRGAKAHSDRLMGHHRAYDYYSNSLYDFRRIDLCHCFDSLNGHTPYLLFTKTGTHWSNIASTYAFDSVMRYMQTFGPAIRPVTLGQPYHGSTREPDADLDDLLNKTFPIPTERNQYVDVTLAEPAPERNPSLVVIGDSFFWNILYRLLLLEHPLQLPHTGTLLRFPLLVLLQHHLLRPRPRQRRRHRPRRRAAPHRLRHALLLHRAALQLRQRIYQPRPPRTLLRPRRDTGRPRQPKPYRLG